MVSALAKPAPSMAAGFTFYLGTHKPSWLTKTDVPLFVSHRALEARASLPRARGPWALDSGGFTELGLEGRWRWERIQSYAGAVLRYQATIGQLEFASIQDWMCEPHMLQRTGEDIESHQSMSCLSLLQLRDEAPGVPWLPVLQGWEIDDYLRHVEVYRAWGVRLEDEPRVGLGSVCRRQGTAMSEELVRVLAGTGLRLHLFGFKVAGLKRCARYAASSDSLSWSLQARKERLQLEGCSHATCANCLRWALRWRALVLEGVEVARAAPEQGRIAFPAAPVFLDRCVACGCDDFYPPRLEDPEITCIGCGHSFNPGP